MHYLLWIGNLVLLKSLRMSLHLNPVQHLPFEIKMYKTNLNNAGPNLKESSPKNNKDLKNSVDLPLIEVL